MRLYAGDRSIESCDGLVELLGSGAIAEDRRYRALIHRWPEVTAPDAETIGVGKSKVRDLVNKPPR